MFAAILSQIVPLLIGKAAESVVTGSGAGNMVLQVATKGLLKSKTANYAHLKVVGGVLALYAMELPQILFWGLTAAILIDWGVNIYLRVRTNSPV